jgi:hypothetical protein
MKTRFPGKPPVNGSFPVTFVPNTPPVWTTAGLTNVESVTNFQVYFPSIDKTVGVWVMLPAGYTAGSFTCATMRFGHGSVAYPTNGAGAFSGTLPAAYDDAVAQGILTTPTIMYGYHGAEYPMDTNTPTGVPMESIALLVHEWVHSNYRTKGKAAQHNVIAGFSMCGRGAFYLFNKYAKLHRLGQSAWCWGGLVALGPPVYDETYAYQANAGSLTWAQPCISPSGAWTATELAVWATKTGQYWLDPESTNDKLMLIMYGQGDAVYGNPGVGAGNILGGRLAATSGLLYDFRFGLLNDSAANITHSPTLYLNARNNVTRPMFGRVQEVFSGFGS